MENYSYPTRDEWLEYSMTFPFMGRYGFSFVNEFNLLLEGEKSSKEVHQIQNLYHWDSILSTKVWNLRQSYINALVNFKRGIAKTDQDFENELKIIHLRQFEFYFETTVYYLVSTRDVIYQIVNLAFIEVYLPENEVTLIRILKKIQDVHLRGILVRSSTNLKDINDLRNSMAHRFPKTANDFRSEISEDGRIYSSYKRKAIDYDKRIEKLKNGLEHLYQFYSEIKVELSKKFVI
ncbi:Cthe_2314 family HEPN domain-containing protein [Algoriphagus sp.]|uniref:Cthe_2314 family HEPN domain-containing protein n=1 Tax=Algoriphagus sp. TaxID=1872435 RepID=UPI003F708E3C